MRRRFGGLSCKQKIGTADQGGNTWKIYMYNCSMYSRKQRGIAEGTFFGGERKSEKMRTLKDKAVKERERKRERVG